MSKKQRKHFTVYDCIFTKSAKRQFRAQVGGHEDFATEAATQVEARRLLIQKIFQNLWDYTAEQWVAQCYEYPEGERLWCFARSNDEVYFDEWFH